MTYEIAGKISNMLRTRLEGGKLIQDHIFPEMEQFQKEMRELDDLIAIADRGIKQSKAAIVIWRKSHQTMAAGITEPAAIDLFGIAKAAIKKVAQYHRKMKISKNNYSKQKSNKKVFGETQ